MGNFPNHIKLIKVLTSLKEYSDGFIKASQKKTAVSMGNSANHIKFIKLCSSLNFQERLEQAHIFQFCGYNIVTAILPLDSFQTLPFICDQFVEALVAINSESCQTSFPSFLRTAIRSGSLNHVKFIKLCSRNGRTFFNIVVTYVLSEEDIQEIQDSPPVLCDIQVWLESFKNSTLFWLLSH